MATQRWAVRSRAAKSAIDHRGPYLAHCPDRRIRDLVEVAGESLEPAECPCRHHGTRDTLAAAGDF